jgi:hypothetical protein
MPVPKTACGETPGNAAIGNQFASDAIGNGVCTCRVLRLPDSGVAAYGCSVPGSGAVETLAAGLLDALAKVDRRWSHCARWRHLSVLRTPLGQPLLFGDGMAGPAISLSRVSGRLWGAVYGRQGVGIDVALRDEFIGTYPFHRAFGPNELTLATGCIGTDLPLAAAGIWAVKEAAVKAVGTGFHGFDPREVEVVSLEPGSGGYLSRARVGLPCPVWLAREGPGWVAVALVPW